jgi:CDP-4-dehydro-6-deoxyglucose reductase, E3
LPASAQIERITVHTDGTRRIRLRLDAARGADRFRFLAGQYLQVIAADGTAIPFSIASSPTRLPTIELHYYPVADSDAAAAMNRLLRDEPQLLLDGPYGDIAFVGPSPKPLVLIVAGTGAAQAHSIVEFFCDEDQCAPVALFWHVAESVSLYCHDDFIRFSRKPWFTYRPLAGVLSGNTSDANDDVRTWLVSERDRLESTDVILCGSPDFVYRLADALSELQFDSARIRSDVFSHAPR